MINNALIVALFVLINELKTTIASVNCRYYPFYPDISIYYLNTCEYGCCTGYHKSKCCNSSSGSGLYWIGILFGFLTFLCVVIASICYCCNCFTKQRTTIRPNQTQIPFAHNTTSTTDNMHFTSQCPPYTNPSLINVPSPSTQITYLDELPTYESLMNNNNTYNSTYK